MSKAGEDAYQAVRNLIRRGTGGIRNIFVADEQDLFGRCSGGGEHEPAEMR